MRNKLCKDLMETIQAEKKVYYCISKDYCEYQIKHSPNRRFCGVAYQVEIRKSELERELENGQERRMCMWTFKGLSS